MHDVEQNDGDDGGSEDIDSDNKPGSSEEEVSGEEETDEEDGFGDQGQEVQEQAGSKRALNDQGGKPSKSARIEDKDGKLYQPPTMEELSVLRETQMLYHSNLFRMQMEELLGEVSMKDKQRHQLQDWLTRFSGFLSTLPNTKECLLQSTHWMQEKGVCDPALAGIPDVQGRFIFAPPTMVEFVGSFAASTVTKLNKAIDVMVTMPQECVHKLDWRDGRWLSKRIKYSAWIAGSLREKPDLVASQCWTTHLGVSSRPTLQVTPSGDIGKKWKVNIFPVPPAEFFKPSRFLPEKCNLNLKWFYGDAEEVEMQPPTPLYNWACGVDVFMPQHSRLIQTSLSPGSNLVQGIKLLKIWLAQRRLDRGIGCFSGHVVTLLVLHLLHVKKINAHMSPYQIFRSVLLSLTDGDWSVSGPKHATSIPSEATATTNPQVFPPLYPVVFTDSSGVLNLAATLTLADYKRVRHEAELALSFLSSSDTDSFESLFIKKVEMLQFSDQILCLQLKQKEGLEVLSRTGNHREVMMDGLGDGRVAVWSEVVRVVEEGLGDRKLLVAPLRSDPESWPLDQVPPKLQWSINLGLIFNPHAAWALLTKGPAADTPEVAVFRQFWGEKSSLRRFQDGSFHEAVLWGDPNESVGKRRLIPEEICRWVLGQQLDIKKKSVHFVNRQTEALLHHQAYEKEFLYATGEEATVSFIQAYDSLSRKLRSLDLPLKISAVQSSSDVIRHSRVFPTVPRAIDATDCRLLTNRVIFPPDGGRCKTFTYPMEVMLLLEISGKWPDNLSAIQAIKTEFHLKILEMLRIDGFTVELFQTYLRILWEGYVFHVRVCYMREIYLCRLVDTPDGDCKEQETAAATRLERHTDILPRFSTALASMQADHSSFSGAVRLCKRWVSSQLLCGHLPQVAVELLVAYLYLVPAPYTPPHTPHVAFLRFLHLLAHTDWKTTPFLVNLNDAFTVEDLVELNQRFTSQRSTLPSMFVVTPYDLRNIKSTEDPADKDKRYKLASHWTRTAPLPQILYRSKQLAGAALDFFSFNLLKKTVDIKTVFRPSYDDYDVVIHLEDYHLSRLDEAVDPKNTTTKPSAKKKGWKPQMVNPKENQTMPIAMFDPAFLYVKELRESYGHLALFFHDEHGGQVVGVVWKPAALTPQELKINTLEGHKVVGVKEFKQVMNIDAILSDFKSLGIGLVGQIKLKKT
ncbi:hypothetical protein Pcinc_014302 [Petrolisthes cinctipes]|uniref:Nucleolar protein 6 n=1 Tax=Petrolisthes cinctipes TaxID=88211 RepID=A0AAE1FVL8_PETCI|nr:hypothetical protein Pcinc_014302 [Petrolisthes cinctipes]